MATDATGTDQVIGRLGMSQFPNNARPAGQRPEPVERHTPTPAPPSRWLRGRANAPVVFAGALEGSNVNMADEFTRLIQAQRGYQMNSKVVQAWDDVQRMANELRGA